MRDLRIAETHAVSGAGINGTQAVMDFIAALKKASSAQGAAIGRTMGFAVGAFVMSVFNGLFGPFLKK